MKLVLFSLRGVVNSDPARDNATYKLELAAGSGSRPPVQTTPSQLLALDRAAGALSVSVWVGVPLCIPAQRWRARRWRRRR